MVALHGGGIRFVATESIEEIRDRGDREDGGTLAFTAEGDSDATITLTFDGGASEDRKAYLPTKAEPNENAKALVDRAFDLIRESGAGATPVPRPYSKIFSAMQKKKKSKEEKEEYANSMIALGEAMSKLPQTQLFSGTPAAYTYFGQFLAHDMTHMGFDGNLSNPENYRSHALDLDSIFGKLPKDIEPHDDLRCIGEVCLGRTSAMRYEDLPRGTATEPDIPFGQGQPYLPDQRNDNNLAVAQMTVAIIKFYHIVHKVLRVSDVEEAKRITTEHFQSIIVHDYLRRIIDPDVYDDVINNGRKIIVLGKHGFAKFFQIPIEFAGACFRFGHSLLRSEYHWNDKVKPGTSTPYNFRRFTALGGELDRGRLPDDWVVDWERLFVGSLEAPERHLGTRIDPVLARDMMRLDRQWIENEPPKLPGIFVNLATLTLLRGAHLDLPTGQELQELIERKARAAKGRTLAIENAAQHDPVLSELDPKHKDSITRDTPLWYFILKEAEVLGCGRTLGPVGSRVVMETAHAALEAWPGSKLDGGFAPHERLTTSETGVFKLNDLFANVKRLQDQLN